MGFSMVFPFFHGFSVDFPWFFHGFFHVPPVESHLDGVGAMLHQLRDGPIRESRGDGARHGGHHLPPKRLAKRLGVGIWSQKCHEMPGKYGDYW